MVSRICLDQLRARKARKEESAEERFPDPVVTEGDVDPEHEVVLSDSLGLAIHAWSSTSSGPAERLAFVLHDVFGLAFRRDRPDRRALQQT